MPSELDTLRAAARLAAWAPDEARDLLGDLAAAGGDDVVLARSAELLARVFAVTGAWELAAESYATAAATWEPLDPPRAVALRSIAACLPLEPYTSERDALMTELELVRQIFETGRPQPIVRRAVAELRRALHPRPILGRLEAAFGLMPGEVAFVLAAAAPILDPDCAPLLTADDWSPLLGSSSLDGPISASRVLALGLVRATPELVPHPAVISCLLGRTRLEQPAGVRLTEVEAIGRVAADIGELARALVTGLGFGVVVGPAGSGRLASVAALLRPIGRRLFAARPGPGAEETSLVDAAVEAGLHDGLLGVDLDDWPGVDLERLAALAPLVVTSREEPAIAEDRRAFSLYPLPGKVSSPR